MFREKMVTEAIPERVFVLCKIVEEGPILNSDLKEKMEPSYLDQKTVYYNYYRNAAEELGLITISDNWIKLAVASDIISNIASFRKYINSQLKAFRDGQFYQVTKAYFELDSSVLAGEQNLANLAFLMQKMTNTTVDAVAMRAWRFWVTFLGFGYLQNMFVLPNADVFLKDVIELSKLDKERRYSFSEFIDEILPYSEIIINPDRKKKQLNYGVSNGLRLLHANGEIKLEHILDQEDIWNLYPLKAHEISGTITNITICRRGK